MANLVLGLYSPFKYAVPEWEGYNIKEFQNYIRFLIVIEDRDNGSGGQICPLLFDGAVSSFNELPLPSNKVELARVMSYVNRELKQVANPVFMGVSVRKKSKKKTKLQRIKQFFKFAT